MFFTRWFSLRNSFNAQPQAQNLNLLEWVGLRGSRKKKTSAPHRRARFLESLETRLMLDAGAVAVLDAATWNESESFSFTGNYGETVLGDELVPVDVTKSYHLSGWARSGNDDGSEFNPQNRQFFGFAAYDIDRLLIEPGHVNKYGNAVDTTLAEALVPGATSILLANASGWSTDDWYTRYLVWYGYSDSTNHTYSDFTYTRNLLTGDYGVGAWSAINGNRLILRQPWAGPALPAGTAIRNTTSGSTFNYAALAYQTIPNVWSKYEAVVSSVGTGATQFRPGTAFVKLLLLPNYNSSDNNRVAYRDVQWEHAPINQARGGETVELDVTTGATTLPPTATFYWTQTAGPSVNLLNASSPTAEFVAPHKLADYDLTFRVTIGDGSTTLTDTVTVQVPAAANYAATLDAVAVLDATTWNGSPTYSVKGNYGETVLGDELVPVDVTKSYHLSGWARSGNDDGSEFNPQNRQFFGFAAYDIDRLLIEPGHVNKYGNAVDTTLAEALVPGATSILLANASGWSTDDWYTRYLVWYGYSDSTNHTYSDFTYTRNLLTGDYGVGAWSAINGNRLILRQPWAGPALPAGTAIRNTTSGSTFNYAALAYQTIPNVWSKYEAVVSSVGTGATQFRPGTAFVKLLLLPNYNSSDNNRVAYRDVQWEHAPINQARGGETVELDVTTGATTLPPTATFYWTQTAGPSVNLLNASSPTAEFVAPHKLADYDLTFRVTIGDGSTTLTDTVTVQVPAAANYAATLDAVAVLDATTWNGSPTYSVKGNYGETVLGDELVPVDVTKSYHLSGWARSGNDDGSEFNPQNRQFFGFAAYDIDRLLIEPGHVNKYGNAVDTTLAEALVPGATSILLANASGWSMDDWYTRYLVWYGYSDSTNHTYSDFTYTRNLLTGDYGVGAWSAINGNRLILRQPWAGPALPAGTAIRNTTSGSTFNYAALAYQTIPNAWSKYEAVVSSVGTGATQFRPGTAFVKLLLLPNYNSSDNNRVAYRDVQWEHAPINQARGGETVELDVTTGATTLPPTATFYWTQTAGPSVNLLNASSPTAEFVAPHKLADYDLTFRVTIGDGSTTLTDTVTVQVPAAANYAATLDAVAVLDATTWNGSPTYSVKGNYGETVLGDELVPVDVTKSYHLSGWARSGNDDGSEFNPQNRQFFGFAAYDIDRLLIEPGHVNKYGNAVDTTLAEALVPGATSILLANASGWSMDDWYTRYLVWYGYSDSTNHTYSDFTYTRNLLTGDYGVGAWSAINGNRLILRQPWAGPALPAGTAIRNTTSGSTFNYAALAYQTIPNVWSKYEAVVSSVGTGATQFRPGTAFVKLLLLPNYNSSDNNRVAYRDVQWEHAPINQARGGETVELDVTTGATTLPPTATFYWTQTAGPSVNLLNASSPTAEFVAPHKLADYDLTFRVTIGDGSTTLTDTVTVQVPAAANYAATLDAVAVLDATTWNGSPTYSVKGNYGETVLGDELVPVDVTKSYHLSGWARSGNDDGSEFNPQNRQFFGFAAYDIDRLLIEPGHVNKYGNAVDTTLAEALVPGATSILLANASGWSMDDWYTRYLVWYGYSDSTNHTYSDFTYTRNLLTGDYGVGAWSAINENRLILRQPWAGPALPAGTAIRNTTSGSTFNYAALAYQTIPNAWSKYEAVVSSVGTGATQFRPGTAFVKLLLLPNYNSSDNNRVAYRDVQWEHAPINQARGGETVELDVTTGATTLPPTATFYWTQTAGPSVNLLNASSPTAEFVAPHKLADYDLTFRVTIGDGSTTLTDTVTVQVPAAANYAATLDAVAVLDATTWNGSPTYSVKGNYGETVLGDELVPVDVTKSYHLSGWARSGNDDGSEFNPQNRQFFGFAAYDIDRLLIEPGHVNKYGNAVDTTLAEALVPGATSILLANASGWSTDDWYTRYLVWYGYSDSTNHTYSDFTYTRNLLTGDYGVGAWSAINGNRLILRQPWAGPALPAGTAIRNTTSGSTFNYAALAYQTIPNAWSKYEAVVSSVGTGATQFRPGTAFVKLLLLPNYNSSDNNRVAYRDVQWEHAPINQARGGETVELDVTTGATTLPPTATFYWTQTAGPSVNLLNASSPTAEFVAPHKLADYDLTFRVTIGDGSTTLTDTVTVQVPAAANYAATLDAVAVLDATTWNGSPTYSVKGNYGADTVSDEFVRVDTSKAYHLSGWARSGNDDGSEFNPQNRQFFGFAAYDIDRLLIEPGHVNKYGNAVDTTLAEALVPGATSILLANASGWSMDDWYTRYLVWYGYSDSTNHTYSDFTYTRNLLTGDYGVGAWSAINGNRLILRQPWAGPALPAGTAIRNTTSGSTFNYAALAYQTIPNAWSKYEAVVSSVGTGATQFRPGTAYVKLLLLPNYNSSENNRVAYRDVEWTYAHTWQNTANPFDVNGDGSVTPIDLLLLNNRLGPDSVNAGPLPPVNDSTPLRYYDINGDDSVTQTDFTLLLDYLNGDNTASPPPVFLPDDAPDLKLRNFAFPGQASVKWNWNNSEQAIPFYPRNFRVPLTNHDKTVPVSVIVSDGVSQFTDSWNILAKGIPTMVQVRPEVVNSAGQPITTIGEGQSFFVNVFVDDVAEIPIRLSGGGVFTAYVDLDYSSSLVAALPTFTIGSSFPNGRTKPEFGVPGRILHAGGFASSFASLGSEERLLVQLPFVAQHAGTAVFGTEPNDFLVFQFALYGVHQSVPAELISFGTTSLQIVAAGEGEHGGDHDGGGGNTCTYSSILPESVTEQDPPTSGSSYQQINVSVTVAGTNCPIPALFIAQKSGDGAEVGHTKDFFLTDYGNGTGWIAFINDQIPEYNLSGNIPRDEDGRDDHSVLTVTASVSGSPVLSKDIKVNDDDDAVGCTSYSHKSVDKSQVKISPLTAEVTEDSGATTLVVSGPGCTYKYAIALATSGVATLNTDYTLSTMNVTLGGGSGASDVTAQDTSANVTLTVKPDEETEGAELAIVSIKDVSPAKEAKITIYDNDDDRMMLSNDDSNASEPDLFFCGVAESGSVKITPQSSLDHFPSVVYLDVRGVELSATSAFTTDYYTLSADGATIQLPTRVGDKHWTVILHPTTAATISKRIVVTVMPGQDGLETDSETITFSFTPGKHDKSTGTGTIAVADREEKLSITASPDETSEAAGSPPGKFIISLPASETWCNGDFRLDISADKKAVGRGGGDAHPPIDRPVGDPHWPADSNDPVDYSLSDHNGHAIAVEHWHVGTQRYQTDYLPHSSDNPLFPFHVIVTANPDDVPEGSESVRATLVQRSVSAVRVTEASGNSATVKITEVEHRIEFRDPMNAREADILLCAPSITGSIDIVPGAGSVELPEIISINVTTSQFANSGIATFDGIGGLEDDYSLGVEFASILSMTFVNSELVNLVLDPNANASLVRLKVIPIPDRIETDTEDVPFSFDRSVHPTSDSTSKVTIKDLEERLTITADPEETYEGSSKHGRFIITPDGVSGRTDDENQICGKFHLLINASSPAIGDSGGSAHPPINDPGWVPDSDVDPIDYSLHDYFASPEVSHPVLLERHAVDVSRRYRTEVLPHGNDPSPVDRYEVHVAAIKDFLEEGDETVDAELRVVFDANRPSVITSFGSAQVTIKERMGEAEIDLSADGDCSCACQVCAADTVSLNPQSAAATSSPAVSVMPMPIHVSEGTHGLHPVIRAQFTVPQEATAGSTVTVNVYGRVGNGAPVQVAGPITFAANSQYFQPGATFAFSIIANLEVPDLLVSGKELQSVVLNLEVMISPALVAAGESESGSGSLTLYAKTAHLLRDPRKSPIAPGFQFPFLKKLLRGQTMLGPKGKPEGGTAVFRGDNSVSWYRAGSGAAPETTSTFNGTRLTHRDGSFDEFDANGLHVKMVDRNGNETSFGYDNVTSLNPKLTTITTPDLHVTTISYSGTVMTITDFAGRFTTFAYVASGNQPTLSITHPDPNVSDADDQLIETWTYDVDKRLKTISRGPEDKKQEYTFEFDDTRATHRVLKVTRPDGSIVELKTYRQQEGLPENGSGTLRYGLGKIDLKFQNTAELVDGNGGSTIYKLDHRGRVLRMWDAVQAPLLRQTNIPDKVIEDRSYSFTRAPEEVERDRFGSVLSTLDRGEVTAASTPDPDDFRYLTEGANNSDAKYDGPLMRQVASLVYDERSNVARRIWDGSPTAAKSHSSSALYEVWVHGARNQVEKYVDELGNVSHFDLDGSGNVLRATQNAGTHIDRQVWNSADSNDTRLDVNGDGYVVPIDILLVINFLNAIESVEGNNVFESVDENPYLDVNRDGTVSPIDALLIINYLNDDRSNGNTVEPRSQIAAPSTSAETKYTYTSSRPVPGQTGSGVKGLLDTVEAIAGGSRTNVITDFDYFPADASTPISKGQSARLSTVWVAKGKTDGTEPLQSQVRYTYDDFGNINFITEIISGVASRTWTITSDRLNRPTKTVSPDPDGAGPELPVTTTFKYDVFGNLVQVQQTNKVAGDDPTTVGVEASYESTEVSCQYFDNMNRLIVSVAPAPVAGGSTCNPGLTGDQALTTYGGTHPTTAVVGLGGTGSRFDGNGNPHGLRDASGDLTRFEYDALNRVTKVTVGDTVQELEYDNLGNLWSETDVAGVATHFRYDHLNRLTTIVAPNPDRAFLPAESDKLLPNGVAESLRANGAAVSQIEFIWDRAGWQTTATDPLGRVANQATDFLGRLASVTGPADSNGKKPVTTYTYFKDSLPMSVTSEKDANSVSTVNYNYDPLGRLSTVSVPNPADPLKPITTTYQYDQASQLLSVTDPLQRKTTYEYDTAGRTKMVTAPDPDGDAATANSATMQYAFDSLGNLLSATDAANHKSLYRYDHLSRRVQDVDPKGAVTAYEYALDGNLTSLTDPVLNQTKWTYDQLDRVVKEEQVKEEQVGFGSSTFTYSNVGTLEKKIDRNGRKTEYEYDRLYRPTKELWFQNDADPIADRTITFGYDLAGQLTSVTDLATATLEFTYDNLGRPDLATQTIVGLPQPVTLDHDFNLLGNRTKLAATIGETKDFVNTAAFDTLGRMTSVTQTNDANSASANAVAAKHVAFAYNAASQMTSLSRFEASSAEAAKRVAVSTLGYDRAGRLKTLVHTQAPLAAEALNSTGTLVTVPSGADLLAGYQFDWDKANRLTRIGNVKHVGESVTYSYDARGQLTGATYDPASGLTNESYAFDANGNRASQSAPGQHNRLQNDGTYSYEYDNEGNRTRRTEIATGKVTEYQYDHRNRMVKVTDKASATGAATMSADYTYDPLDRRVTKTIDPDGTGSQSAYRDLFAYDGQYPVLQWRDANISDSTAPQLTHRYLHGPTIDMILADEQLSTASNVLWPLSDHLGTVRDIGDFAGTANSTTVVNHIAYDSFGNVVNETAANVDTLMGFAGLERDEETRLYKSRTRPYDPITGRWIQEDWIGFAGNDTNLIRYANNAPSHTTDPPGLYGVGGHFFTTFIVARAAGYSIQDAYELAYYSQLPDQMRGIDAFWNWKNNTGFFSSPNGRTWARDVYNCFHSMTPKPMSTVELIARRRVLLELLRGTYGKLTTWQRGLVIHGLGDAYAHASGGVLNEVGYGFPAGHGRDRHNPDIIVNDVDKYTAYVLRLYDVLGGVGEARDNATIRGLIELAPLLPDSFAGARQPNETAPLLGYARAVCGFQNPHNSSLQPYIPNDNYNTDPRMRPPSGPSVKIFMEQLKEVFAGERTEIDQGGMVTVKQFP